MTCVGQAKDKCLAGPGVRPLHGMSAVQRLSFLSGCQVPDAPDVQMRLPACAPEHLLTCLQAFLGRTSFWGVAQGKKTCGTITGEQGETIVVICSLS